MNHPVPPRRRPADPTAPQIDVAWRVRADWRAVPLLRRVALHAATAEGWRGGTLSVAVVGRRAMARLHADFCGVPGPTDVLTFDLGGDRRRRRLEGEIVVCTDVARAAAGTQAGMAGWRRELALYVVHGVLHLSGYDDHAPADFRRMHAREDELLGALGLGAVFAERAVRSAGRSAARGR